MAFVLVLIVFFVTSEYLIRTQVEPNDSLKKNVALFFDTVSNNAAFGDSHVALGFNSDNRFINLGYPGESLRTTSQKVLAFYSKKQHGIAIIQVDPHVFSGRRVRGTDLGKLYLASGEYKWYWLRFFDDYYRPKLFKYWEKYIKNGRLRSDRIFYMYGQEEFPTKEQKWHKLSNKSRTRMVQKRVKYNSPQAHYFGEAFGLLNGVVERLRSNHIDVCFVTYPVSPEFLNIIDSRNNDYYSTIAKFKKWADSQHVTYFNYFRMFDNHKNYFADADHLNMQGSSIFTKRVIKDCMDNIHRNHI